MRPGEGWIGRLFDLDVHIDARVPSRRELTVELRFAPRAVASVGADHVDLFAPVWTPGSYLVREYSRHHGRVTAVGADGTTRRCAKVAKNRVRVEFQPGDDVLVVRWTVYAHELSVRTADLTDAHAYWNHACLLLWPVGGEGLRARVQVAFPADWQIATAAAQRPAVAGNDAGGLAVFEPRELAAIVDAPILIGRNRRIDWTIRGVLHSVVLDGLAGIEPRPTLAADIEAIVEQAAAVFGGDLPYARYLFLCLFAEEGHGGLEHAESTTLLTGRAAFASDKGYREFLSLAAHELFHAWNVKRLRPVEFWQYDYERENYTDFLWLIEGWTAYYDDLLCLRAGLFTRAQYLEAMAKNVETMLGAPGRRKLSLRESSHDAWIRLYRPDENTRNSSQNYYGNGAVAAMCLDLHIRLATDGSCCLDDVLRRLWATTFARGRGYTRSDVDAALAEVAGPAAIRQLAELVDDRLDPPLAELLASFGLALQRRDTDRVMLGVQFASGSLVVASVTAGTPADEAGLHPGDEVLAVAGLRASASSWQDLWSAVAKAEANVEVLIARRGVVQQVRVRPVPSQGSIALEVRATTTADERRRLAAWLPERPEKR